jgi:DNA-binding transcriptional LysR family regulator
MNLFSREFDDKNNISKMDVAMQVYGNADVLQAVSLGSGVGFVTRSLLATNPDYNNVVAVQIKRFKIDRYLYLVRQKSAPFTSGMQMLWDFALGTSWREKAFPFNTLTN